MWGGGGVGEEDGYFLEQHHVLSDVPLYGQGIVKRSLFLVSCVTFCNKIP